MGTYVDFGIIVAPFFMAARKATRGESSLRHVLAVLHPGYPLDLAPRPPIVYVLLPRCSWAFSCEPRATITFQRIAGEGTRGLSLREYCVYRSRKPCIVR